MTTPRNSYATLLEFTNYIKGSTITTNATDDGVINQLLEGASRFLDDKMGRWFYPDRKSVV